MQVIIIEFGLVATPGVMEYAVVMENATFNGVGEQSTIKPTENSVYSALLVGWHSLVPVNIL